MDKAELRRAVIARRNALDLDVRAAKSAAICARLVELLDRLGTTAPHTVAVYAAMGSEVDPAAFAARRNSALSISTSSSKPAKKGQVYFGRFYLGKRKKPVQTTTKASVPYVAVWAECCATRAAALGVPSS